MMNASRRRIYLGLLTLAALGLVLDRFVFTPGATTPAEASAALVAPHQGANGTAIDKAGSLASIPEIPFPPGLKTANQGLPILDVFAPPGERVHGEFDTDRPDNGTGSKGRRGPPERLGGAAFERRHTLDGVLIDQRLKMAVLDGRPMKIGDTTDGCSLESVSDYRAMFKCHDGPAALKVKGAGARGPG